MGCSGSTPVKGSNSYPKQKSPPAENKESKSTPQQQQQQQQKPSTTSQQQHQQQQQQQSQQQNGQQTAATKAQEKPKQRSEEEVRMLFEKYLALEKQVRELEQKNVVGNYQAKLEQQGNVKKRVETATEHYKKVCEKVAKEKADVDRLQEPSVKSFIKDQSSFDAEFSKEQEEYLEAVNEQEIAKKEMDSLKAQSSSLEKEVKDLKTNYDKLMDLYEQQDDLLDKIFSGEYGSEKENKLEAAVDELLDLKERISTAKYKWGNARILLQHACNQLAFACRRWLDLAGTKANNMQMRYTIATETRNNLVAAKQNIDSAQRYLVNIKFPYCQPSEMVTLEKAYNNIYTDMQSHDRQQHAHQCYSVTHRRAAALMQWFDSVIEKTINVDQEKTKTALAKKEMELRQERLTLIKEKMGINIELSDQGSVNEDDELEPELVEVMKPDPVTGAEDLPKGEQEEGGESGGLKPDDDRSAAPPTPLPLNELAPPPSQDALFGNVEELKKQHEKDMAEFEKTQEMNRARVEQGLEEKLRARRSRRRRLQNQNE